MHQWRRISNAVFTCFNILSVFFFALKCLRCSSASACGSLGQPVPHLHLEFSLGVTLIVKQCTNREIYLNRA